MADPMTDIYANFRSALEAHDPLMDLVKKGNRIWWDEERAGRKPKVQDADLAQLELAPTSMQIDRYASHAGLLFQLSMELRVSTGKRQVDKRLWPLTFEVVRAVERGVDNVKRLGIDDGKISQITMGDADFAFDDTELNQGRKGWSANFPVSVHFILHRARLLEDFS